MRRLIILLAALLTPSVVMANDGKIARCVISEPHGHKYDGPCEFTIMDKAGSFFVAIPETSENRYFIYPMWGITLWVKSKGIGEAVGHTKALTVRMGEYQRSTSDRACWVDDEEYSICAY